jgi:hypothetical protein
MSLLAPAIFAIAGSERLTAQTLERTFRTTPTVVIAGPSWLSAAGYIPTKIMLKWKAVPKAVAYRVFRSSSLEARHLLGEWPLSNLAGFYDMGTDSYYSIDWPVDMTSTYKYDVQAVFVDDTGKNFSYSASSPAASAQSPAFVAPSNFKYSVGVYQTPGKLRLTFTWDAVPNAQQYDIMFQALTGRSLPIVARTGIKGTTLVIDDVSPRTSYNVCIVTVYLPSIRDDTVRSCIAVNL